MKLKGPKHLHSPKEADTVQGTEARLWNDGYCRLVLMEVTKAESLLLRNLKGTQYGDASLGLCLTTIVRELRDVHVCSCSSAAGYQIQRQCYSGQQAAETIVQGALLGYLLLNAGTLYYDGYTTLPQ